ncbi:MAG: PAS domain-containing protein [Balneola sp.]|nr:PAS domain-containing protein [Balneola sp.]MBO6651013.1 PAS domain-containing protein [Balneola sp.]MBO6711174.1 PAS domain-containing protein [Balneola sp.]MBO6800711.1 PAS domain-containing protein [Balneola sp.]MBO6869110.1 PAS domain-containing protein [Balneola sp.]
MSKKKIKVVGIGASAGGLDAITKLFKQIPSDTGMAFVIVQHLSPDFESLMPELLSKHTSMEIITAVDKLELLPNRIYLNERTKNLHIKGNKLYLLDKGPKSNLNLPIDILFHTLGEEFKESSIGVILSGTGSDGSRGIKTIKERGGTVLVQDPAMAQFVGMPNSAISTNIVDYIKPVEELGKTLSKISSHSFKIDYDGSNSFSDYDLLDKIFELINKKFRIDFSVYKKATILRRIEKRLAINSIQSLQKYLELLKEDNNELTELFNDCLISVTSFFRDKEAFQLLQKQVIPEIVNQNLDSGQIRVWVAACSTGQEAYTIAMLLDEYITSTGVDIDFKIFASDVDHISLNTASDGIYPINICNEIEERYLNKYFKHGTNGYEITRSLRKKIVFTQHDILRDPPFIRTDLISCRNLLIYFNKESQEKALKNLRFSLNPGGALLLGPSESLGNLSKSFKAINNKWNLYQNVSKRRFSASSPTQNLEVNVPNVISKTRYYNDPPADSERYSEPTFHKLLANRFAPDCLIIDEEFNILFVKGNAGKKLQFSEGIFDSNLLNLIPDSLVKYIRIPVLKLLQSHKEVIVEKIASGSDENPQSFDLTFSYYDINKTSKLILIEFSKEQKLDESVIKVSNIYSDQLINERIVQLEEELKASKTQLRNAIEELETSNEELQSSNEELMSANEELQSTNEELQSVNEELYTVNQEFQIKNNELSQLNDDISNLLDSTDIGTLFLDNSLRIRKFTPALNQFFNLNENDIGQPITSFTSTFNKTTQKQLVDDAKEALNKLTTLESEVVNNRGDIFLCRVRPFVTTDKLIDGVVITFVNITSLKAIESDLLRKTEELNNAQKIAKIGSWYFDIESGEVSWTEELYRMYGFDPEVPPPPFSEHENLFTKQSWELLSKNLDEAFENKVPYNLELEMKRDGSSIGWMRAMGEPVLSKKGELVGLRGVAQDITQEKQLLEQIKYEKEFSKQVSDSTSMGIYIFDVRKGSNTYMNRHYSELLGYTIDEINAMKEDEFIELFHPDDRTNVIEHMSKIMNGQYQAEIEYRFKHKKGHWVWCYSIDSPFDVNEDGTVNSFIGVFLDIGQKKKDEHALKLAKQKAENANAQKNSFLANMSHEIRTPISSILGFLDFLKNDELSPEDKELFIEIIETNSAQLLNLIEDILDISKIEANQVALNIAPTDLKKLLDNLLINFSGKINSDEKPDLNLKIDIPKGRFIKTIYTDSIRLNQILSNLIGNAIKFSTAGTISFGYTKEKNMLRFFVKDEGIGIKKEKLGKIFTRFKQVHDVKHQAQFGGTGLGLSISHDLVKMLGGEISVTSEFGKGATFFFTIPIGKKESEKSNGELTTEANQDYDFSGIQVLVVDDEPTIRIYYKKIFEMNNINILIAENGKEAVAMYKANTDIDLVLMDIRMPIMGGIEATKLILEHDPNAKIIAQTAYTMNNENKAVKEIGCIDYLSKPISKSLLIEKLNHWIHNTKLNK